MMDFLKAYPFITMEQYLWEIPLAKIQIMSMDATKIIYLTEKQAKKYGQRERVYTDPDALMNDLGIPIFE